MEFNRPPFEVARIIFTGETLGFLLLTSGELESVDFAGGLEDIGEVISPMPPITILSKGLYEGGLELLVLILSWGEVDFVVLAEYVFG